MPRTGVIYDILLSCPGDVLDLKDIVNECIQNFNHYFGPINNTTLQLKHWSTDSYPQSGGHPQELLNNQFIHDCDACIALLWSKFGTPTENYDSGTEEEIEDMIKSGKQVFLYFVDRPIEPSAIDMMQYTKISEFKEKYKNRGVYSIIKSTEELKKELTNHLPLYFLNKMVERSSSNSLQMPNLEFLDCTGKPEGKLIKAHFSTSQFINKNVQTIKDNITLIDKMIVEQSKVKSERIENSVSDTDTEKDIFTKDTINYDFFTNHYNTNSRKVSFDEKDHLIINEFCANHYIEITSEFWDIGNLSSSNNILRTPNGPNKVFLGTESEKEKFNKINKIISDIVNLNEWVEYFFEIDKYLGLNCIIRNSGTAFDEDIDVKIRIPKDNLIKLESYPVPGYSIIDMVNDNDIINKLFTGSKSADIEAYSDYQTHIESFDFNYIQNSFPYMTNTSIDEKYSKAVKRYKSKLSELFCYNVYEEMENLIITFNIKYLKHNTSMYLPTILLFSHIPESIDYEIISKHMPNVQKGKMILKI
ncbi:MAG: hypothetical protein K0S41_3654 [Anaerocolumna sp.]|jgi:hypothetical protein|nr:hypothetical protein [Anaerocolumna sp.]